MKNARQWFRFRGFGPDDSQLVLVRMPPKSTKPAGWIWQQTRSGPTSITRALGRAKGPGGAPQWQVMLDGEGGPWRIRSGALIYRDAPLEERRTRAVALRRGLPVAARELARLDPEAAGGAPRPRGAGS